MADWAQPGGRGGRGGRGREGGGPRGGGRAGGMSHFLSEVPAHTLAARSAGPALHSLVRPSTYPHSI